MHGWNLADGWQAGKSCFCGERVLADPSEGSKDELIATLRARVQVLEETATAERTRYVLVNACAEQAEERVRGLEKERSLVTQLETRAQEAERSSTSWFEKYLEQFDENCELKGRVQRAEMKAAQYYKLLETICPECGDDSEAFGRVLYTKHAENLALQNSNRVLLAENARLIAAYDEAMEASQLEIVRVVKQRDSLMDLQRLILEAML
jgi:hypothetical protein